MTRDEAIKVFDQNTNIHDRSDTPRWIDRLVALGILKLDEPMSAVDRLADALGWEEGSLARSDLYWKLQKNGLRIVEK